jgi:ABC-type multidrug transport system fused ATPase/permease subunit
MTEGHVKPVVLYFTKGLISDKSMAMSFHMAQHAGRSFSSGSAAPRRLLSAIDVFRRFLPFARPHRALLIGAFLMMLVLIALSLATVKFTQFAFEAVQGIIRDPDWYAAGGRDEVILWTIAISASTLVMISLGILNGWMRIRGIQGVLNEVRARFYDRVQRLSFEFHDSLSTGQIISRGTGDVGGIRQVLVSGLFSLPECIISIIGAMAMLFNADWRLALIPLSISPLILWASYRFAARTRTAWREQSDLMGDLSAIVQENVSGVRVVRAFGREPGEIDRFEQKNDSFTRAHLHALFLWMNRYPVVTSLYRLCIPAAFAIGGVMVMDGRVSIPLLMVFILYFQMIQGRLFAIGELIQQLQNGAANADRVIEVLEFDRGVTDPGDPLRLPAGRGHIVFRRLSFTYPEPALFSDIAPGGPDAPPKRERHPVLVDIDLEVRPGERVAIVGPTGSGKTTLMALLARFYDADSGEAYLDGVDIRRLRLEDLRSAIGFVFQESFLFSTTIAANIAYARPEATQAEIEAAARAAQAHEFIAELENGYNTLVGERGVTLSGGQRQRIAIARAFLKNPRILVLDDATSSVDAETERKIQDAISEVSRGRTTFIISQRASAVRGADRIVVLDRGRVVEIGPHEELMAAHGLYRKMFEEQVEHDRGTDSNGG